MTRRSISLYRRIENALETIALGSTPLDTIKSTAHFLVGSFAQDLGISGGRIYVQENGTYEIVSTFGDVDKSPIGQTVQRSYPPFDQLLDVGSAVMRRDDERLDARIEAELGTREWFAAVAVADGAYVLSFDFEADGESNQELRSTLNIIRLAINQKLREDRMLEILEDARRIQNSILPRRLPRIRNFQIGARTVPAEIVGGDFYDIITPGEAAFNVVVADATGHGLPAALQVRDVFTGLRMGLSRDFKLTRTLERLNRIIHRSRLSTKFVSLFLAEVEHNGTVLYSNAGHPPALLVRASGAVQRLKAGGMILGPMPNATYGIGLARMEPGDMLVLYTDGITEATTQPSGEEFGEERMVDLLVRYRGRQPSVIIDQVFAAVEQLTGASSQEDDQTVVVVKRRQAD
jgi:sigma-B regulation protein RsbU (phosphoserine phosphatase)